MQGKKKLQKKEHSDPYIFQRSLSVPIDTVQCVCVCAGTFLHHFQHPHGNRMLPNGLPDSSLCSHHSATFIFLPCPPSLLSALFSVLPSSPRHPWRQFTALMGHWERERGDSRRERERHVEEETTDDWGLTCVVKKKKKREADRSRSPMGKAACRAHSRRYLLALVFPATVSSTRLTWSSRQSSWRGNLSIWFHTLISSLYFPFMAFYLFLM